MNVGRRFPAGARRRGLPNGSGPRRPGGLPAASPQLAVDLARRERRWVEVSTRPGTELVQQEASHRRSGGTMP